MTRNWRRWALAVSAIALWGSAEAAPPNGAMLANACAGCHGTLGASVGPSTPSLAAQSRDAIFESMKDFRDGSRPSTVMGRLAKGYSDAEIGLIADYLSNQKPHDYDQVVDTDKAHKGSVLQAKYCDGCHTNDGREFKDDTPIVAGQWLIYLQLQMTDYQTGRRKMPDKMAEKVKQLSAEDLDAIVQFYASEKQGTAK